MCDDPDVNKDALFLDPFSNLCDDPEVNKKALFLNPLINLCDDPDVNKDALFLNSLAKVFEIDTSEIFLCHVRKFQSVYDEARRSMKIGIENKL